MLNLSKLHIRTNPWGEENVTFVISNASIAWVNSLRRAAIDDVPILAVDAIEIKHNTHLPEEYIRCRLSLLPINTQNIMEDLKLKNLDGEIPLSFTLNEKSAIAPGIHEIYSSAIVASNKNADYISPDFLILPIKGDGQTAEFIQATFKLKAGTGRQHAIYQSVQLSPFYKQIEELDDLYGSYEFNLTTLGNISFEYIWTQTIKALQTKAEIFLEQFRRLINTDTLGQLDVRKVQYEQSTETSIRVQLIGETETLAGIIQSEIMDLYSDVFCSINRPSLKNDIIEIKITGSAPVQILIKSTEQMLAKCNDLEKQLTKFYAGAKLTEIARVEVR